MKLCIFTIVLDGMPWITKHLPVFQQLKCDWKWIVVEGTSQNNGSTRWCKAQQPRLSHDGTREYLESVHKSICYLPSPSWESKDQMVNMVLEHVKEPCVLMEIDADELWKPWQLEQIVDEIQFVDALQFRCRYFVGENLITKGHHCYGDMDYEWWRAWKFEPGMKFQSHEPPDIVPRPKTGWTKAHTESIGLVFDHMAYATEPQVRFKEQWYGRDGEYDGLLEGWRRLQEVKDFPVKLSDYFPQVKGDLPVVVKV